LLQRSRLPVTPPPSLDADAFLEHMAVDKKNVEGQLRLILLEKIGRATLPIPVEISNLRQTLETYGRH
jgi:3-dehydroquinate synthase